MSRLLRAVIPEDPLTRRLSLQSVLFAFGTGIFLTGNAVYFTRIVGLTAAQVGLGLSITGIATFLASMPTGRLADRIGSLRAWTIAAGVAGILHLAYPLVHGFAAFVALLCVIAVVEALGRAGRGAYLLDALPPQIRVKGQAYSRSALNIGFTVGALAGGLALATDDATVIRAIPLATAVVLLVNAAFIARLPAVREHVPAADHPVDEPLATVPVATDASSGDGPSGLPRTAPARRNRPFAALAMLGGVLGTHQVVLTVVIPLWLVERTNAPHWTLAWLFGTNTVLAVLFQVPVARRVHDVATSLRGIRIAAGFVVLSCVVIASTGETLGWWTVVLLLLGHMTVTGAELFESAAAWGLLAELSDPTRRGEYQGLWGMGDQVATIVGPAAFTWLALERGALGWGVIAVLVLAAAVLCHPAAHAAAAFLRDQGQAPQQVRSPI